MCSTSCWLRLGTRGNRSPGGCAHARWPRGSTADTRRTWADRCPSRRWFGRVSATRRGTGRRRARRTPQPRPQGRATDAFVASRSAKASECALGSCTEMHAWPFRAPSRGAQTLIAITATVALMVVTRLPFLGAGEIDYDEGVYWLSLQSMHAGHPLFTAVYSSQPPAFLLFLEPPWAALGASISAARAVMLAWAVVGVAAGSGIGGRLRGGGAANAGAGGLGVGPLRGGP